MNSDSDARIKALAAIEMGWVPDRRPDHLWGGRASRGYCAACRSTMKTGEIALEIQFIDDGGARTATHDVHVRCYLALEDQWNRREAVMQHSPRSTASKILKEGGA